MRKFLSALLALVLALSLLPAAAFAATAGSGSCGTHATWTLDKQGTLTISGSGAMTDYTATTAPPWRGSGVKRIVVEEGITAIGKYAFARLDGVTDVSLPHGLTEIRACAFTDSDGLSAIELPDTVQSIGKKAFADCDGLRELWIPDSVTFLSTYVLQQCDALEAVYLPSRLTTVPEGTFEDAANLRLVMMHPVDAVEKNAFAGCTALSTLYWLGDRSDMGQMDVAAGNDAFGDCAVYLALVITRQPEDATTSVGGRSVTMSAAASHKDARFWWMSLAPGAEEWRLVTELEGYRTDTLTIPAEAKYDGYQFACYSYVDEAEEGIRESRSDAATVTVLPAPQITTQPQTVRVKSGEKATVTVEATGEGLSYAWYYAESGSKTFTKTDSFKTNTYSVTMNESRGGRRVYCKITDRYGASVTSDKVTLVMISDLAITRQPADIIAGDGKTAAITVKASGVDLTYDWYWAAPGSEEFFLTDSFNGSTYSVKMNDERNGRRVYCVVGDRYGNFVTSDIATMTMAPRPVITVQPTNAMAEEGKEATVTFTAEGEGLQYTWYWAAKGSATFKKTDTFTGPSYTAEMTEARDGRRVYCVVTDKYGVSVRTNTVTLRIGTPLVITRQPQSVTVSEGKTASVTVVAEGSGLKYEWYWAAKGSKDFQKTDSFTTDTYAVTMNADRDGRRVYCKIIDQYGQSVKSEVATLSMGKADLVITQQPQSVTVENGAEATVTVGASGDGLKYAWYWAPAGSDDFKLTTTFTGDTYTVTMNEARAGRKVYCQVSDKYGRKVKSQVAVLDMIRTPLVLERLPEDVTVREGSKATVTVEATGDGLKYAWYWAAPGSDTFARTDSFTSNTYAVTMNADRDGRRVYCEITDKYGSTVQTKPVTISMVKPPVITVEPTFVYARKGEEAVVSFEATGSSELTYTWYWAKAGSSSYKKTTTFTGPEYTAEMTDDRAGRKVYCVVTDAYGQTARTKTVTLRMALEITGDIESVKVASGKKASVTVKANGQGLQYAWYYSDNDGKSFAKTTSFTGNTYAVTMTKARAGRQVYCVITDKYGNKVESSVAVLRMK